MELKDFWAKTQPFQSVETHGIVSGCVCRYLMQHYLSEGSRSLAAKLLGMTETELLDFMAYLTSLHDIGKIEYHFQCMDSDMKTRLKELGVDRHYLGKEFFRHEKTGETMISRIWEQQDQDDDSAYVFAALIGAHHQRSISIQPSCWPARAGTRV